MGLFWDKFDHENKEFFATYGIYFAIGLYYIIYKEKVGEIIFDKAAFNALAAIAFVYITATTLEKFRYHSPFFIANGIGVSISEKPEIIGDYAVFAGGGVRSFGIYNHGKKSTIVVPVSTIKKVGENWVSSAYVEKVPFGNLPEDVTNKIETVDYYNLGNTFLGYFTENQLNENPEFKVLEAENLKLNSRITELNDLLRGKYEAYEDHASHVDRIGKIGGKKSFMEKIGFGRSDEE